MTSGKTQDQKIKPVEFQDLDHINMKMQFLNMVLKCSLAMALVQE